MNTLYLDLFSGISGDMFVGAMLDLGVPLAAIEAPLNALAPGEFHLHVARQTRGGIAGTKFDVHLEHDHGHHHAGDHHPPPTHDHGHDHGHHHHHDHGQAHAHIHDDHTHPHARTFADIRAMIEGSALSDWVKARSISVFRRIAEAEGSIHGELPDAVHFHEVGAIDSIVDIVGACLALEQLGKPRVFASAVVEGTGHVRCAHGQLPLPAPATLAILGARGVAITQCDEPHELITPTGAALVAEFVETFGAFRGLTAGRIGYGLGTRENRSRPNVLRAVLGRMEAGAAGGEHDWETDTVAVLETNLDDVSGEVLGHFVERALAAGALDVFHTPIQMKKNRPGVLLTVLCAESEADRFAAMLLTETSAFGVRRHVAERRKLRREFTEVTTPWGTAQVKLGKLDGRVVHATPEYESCKQLAAQAGVTLQQVYDEVARAARVIPPPAG